VNVLIDFDAPAEELGTMRDNFRVEVRVIVGRRENVLTIPLGSLFRRQDAWAVYTIAGGTARLQTLEVGARSRTHAEVVRGLDEGAIVVLYPPDTLGDGTRVEVMMQP
jgi:HlyD family secretion protein